MQRKLLWIGIAAGFAAVFSGFADWPAVTVSGAVLLLLVLFLLPWVSDRHGRSTGND